MTNVESSDGRSTTETAEATRSSSFCRVCHNGCPIQVEVKDGRVTGVAGDRGNSLYAGYTCVKGRATPEQLYHPERLLRSRKLQPDGSHRDIDSAQMIDEIAARLLDIVKKHGPGSVACYMGTAGAVTSPTVKLLLESFMDALGSPHLFTANTIDQPGKLIARALHGTWLAPAQAFDDPDVGLVIGANPLVTYVGGLPTGNPGRWLQGAFKRGFQLIVVDPRRSDLAKRATIHLQAKPGEDAALLAAMIRVILTEDMYDRHFVDDHVSGVDQLLKIVEPFTVDDVARVAGVDAEALLRAARTFAQARRGYAVAATGANMSGSGTLVEYLLLALNTLCGRWLRAGERVAAPISVISMPPPTAQAVGPVAGYDLGELIPGTGLRPSAAGPPTGVLPFAILSGEDQRIRALISVAGNPVVSWPDQIKTIDAMKKLELLVQVDIKMSATANLAQYVVASKMPMETPSFTALQESLSLYGVGYAGYPEPWAQYTDAIVDPPEGADLIEEWEFLFRLGQAMGLSLVLRPKTAPGSAGVEAGTPLDMSRVPKTEELLHHLAAGARISLEEVKAHPGGALFPDPPVVVLPGEPNAGRLDVGNAKMMDDLSVIGQRVQAEPPQAGSNSEYPLRLIPRRQMSVYNSSGRSLSAMHGRYYNPAFMNPDDIDELKLQPGEEVQLASATGSIIAIVEADATLRRGVVSMSHCFGDIPERDREIRSIGSPTSRLLTIEGDLQPYSGQPYMSNIPISVRQIRPSPLPAQTHSPHSKV